MPQKRALVAQRRRRQAELAPLRKHQTINLVVRRRIGPTVFRFRVAVSQANGLHNLVATMDRDLAPFKKSHAAVEIDGGNRWVAAG